MGKRREDPAFCRYGAKKILALTEDLAAEIPGVREGKDLECIHRMRVATRRLRAAFRTFSGCAKRGKIRRLQKALRRTAAVLGAARDLDVQIGVLEEILDGLKEDRYEAGSASVAATPAAGDGGIRDAVAGTAALFRRIGTGIWARIQEFRRREIPAAPPREGEGPDLPADPRRLPGPSPRVAAVECLLLRSRQQRAALQPRVVEAVDRLDRRGIAREIGEAVPPPAGGEGDGDGAGGWQMYLAAFLAIHDKQEALRSYGSALQDPAAILDHHAMRIAAKRYRYTLEILNGLYDRAFDPVITDLKGLQDLLGEMHDCDVWVQVLPTFLEEERARSVEYFGHDGFFRFMEPGLRWFGESRAARRSELHEDAWRHWQEMHDRKVWDTVITTTGFPLLDGSPAGGTVPTAGAGNAPGTMAGKRVTAKVTPDGIILTVPAREPAARAAALEQGSGGGEGRFEQRVVIRWNRER